MSDRLSPLNSHLTRPHHHEVGTTTPCPRAHHTRLVAPPIGLWRLPTSAQREKIVYVPDASEDSDWGAMAFHGREDGIRCNVIVRCRGAMWVHDADRGAMSSSEETILMWRSCGRVRVSAGRCVPLLSDRSALGSVGATGVRVWGDGTQSGMALCLARIWSASRRTIVEQFSRKACSFARTRPVRSGRVELL